MPTEKKRYQGGMFDHVDVPAAASFAICLVLFILLIVGIRSVDYSVLEKPSLETMSDRVSKIIMPLKPLGNEAPKARPNRPAPAANAASPEKSGDRGALARIERSRRSVGEQSAKAEERLAKAAVLSILSGKGSGTRGKSVGAGKSTGFADFGDLDARLGSLEGLTKFDGKKSGFGREGSENPGTRGDAVAATSGIDKMVKGFRNAKRGALSKIGFAEAEAPELMERSAKFTGNRSPSEVASYINKKQSMVAMLYEQRLRINPALEGKLTIVLVIEEDGTVSSVAALRPESTLDDPEFTAELIRRIRQWVFPPSSGGPVEMKSPFVFKPA